MNQKDPRLLAKPPTRLHPSQRHLIRKERNFTTEASPDIEDVKHPKIAKYDENIKVPQIKPQISNAYSYQHHGKHYACIFLQSYYARGECPLRILHDARVYSCYDSLVTFLTVDIASMPVDNYSESAAIVIDVLKNSGIEKDEIIDISFEILQYMVQSSSNNMDLWQNLLQLFYIPLENKDFCCRSYTVQLMKLIESCITQGTYTEDEDIIIYKLLQGNLNSTDRERRASAFCCLVKLIINKPNEQIPTEYLKKFMRSMAIHHDSIMREISIKFLEQLADKNLVSMEYYNVIKDLCKDSNIETRRIALRVLQKMADKYGTLIVKSHNNYEIPLNDEAFAILCAAFNDADTLVRTEAAIVIGKFTNVSPNFLLQTLDKKLIPSMIKQDDNKGRESPYFYNWSSGTSLALDIPCESKSEESKSFIPPQACGAFVTALEDEYTTVRKAAVTSLGILAKGQSNIAYFALDHLADMFNDDIDQVRIDAITALTPLLVYGKISRDQLITICTVLDDALPDSRLTLHDLLCKANLENADCLLLLYQRLQQSLARFPEDKLSIYKCFSFIGRSHHQFVPGILYKVLDIDPVFKLTERTFQEPSHIASLIMVLNATVECEVIASLLPDYMIRQYKSLHSSMPDLVPAIRAFEDESGFHYSNKKSSKISNYVFEYFKTMLSELYKILQLPNTACTLNAMDKHLSQFYKTMDFDEGVSANMRFFNKLCKVIRTLRFIITTGKREKRTMFLIENIFTDLKDLEVSFLSVNPYLYQYIMYIHFLTKIIEWTRYKNLPHSVVYYNIKLGLKKFKSFDMYLTSQGLEKYIDVTKEFEECFDILAKKENFKDEFIGNALDNVVINFKLHLNINDLSFNDKMKLYMANIEQPTKQSERMRVAVLKMPVTVPYVVLLKHFTDVNLANFCIQIAYSDGTIGYISPRSHEFHRVDDDTVRLRTKLKVLFERPWNSIAYITIRNGIIVNRNIMSPLNFLSEPGYFQPIRRIDCRDNISEMILGFSMKNKT
uniref:Integrator complex subunit 4 n=1 Tax=Parastrongyloides trichosuri TaxID=131310 RepID=A0A0N5A263_PARTI